MGQSIKPKMVVIYGNRKGDEPFSSWLNKLRDAKARRLVLARLRRLEQGHYGDCKHLQNGVFELRFFFGSGYRVYFAEDKQRIILLLTAGSKATQKKDIVTAISYWQEYQNHD
ncbi:MAG: type II toxin-antitoxin system RelE/ParE family toxin [Porticoccaceae bacterium]|nr:type II toxin-antitoxin system RelE/ParE family toxin [Porticoccaceae bacterium]